MGWEIPNRRHFQPSVSEPVLKSATPPTVGWTFVPAGVAAGTRFAADVQSACVAPAETAPSARSWFARDSRSHAETAARVMAPTLFLASAVLALFRYLLTP